MYIANPTDIRDLIFANLDHRRFTANLTAASRGILAGVAAAEEQAAVIDLQLCWQCAEGEEIMPGTVIARLTGLAKAIARGEERLLGCLGKASGIASLASWAVELAAGRIRVVSGAWKKMPPELKWMVRHAIATGGMPGRIVDAPFIYLDKNYIRMLGGIKATLTTVRALPGVKVIQVRGEEATIAEETARACQGGAGVIMVDTGDRQDAIVALQTAAAYPHVQIAFAGGIKPVDIPALADLGLHILDIGTAIVDAPLLDMKLDVIGVED